MLLKHVITKILTNDEPVSLSRYNYCNVIIFIQDR